MHKPNVVVLSNEVKSLSQVRRRAKRHGLILKRRGNNQFALCRELRIQPTYNNRRVEAAKFKPVTGMLTLAEIMDLCGELDAATELASIRGIELRIRHSMPSLFDQPQAAAETMVLQ
jgi:hypothetical protein